MAPVDYDFEERWMTSALRAARASGAVGRALRALEWKIFEVSRVGYYGQKDPIDSVAELVSAADHVVGPARHLHSPADVRRELRAVGATGVERRVARTVRGRNLCAHPDVTLMDEVCEALKHQGKEWKKVEKVGQAAEDKAGEFQKSFTGVNDDEVAKLSTKAGELQKSFTGVKDDEVAKLTTMNKVEKVGQAAEDKAGESQKSFTGVNDDEVAKLTTAAGELQKSFTGVKDDGVAKLSTMNRESDEKSGTISRPDKEAFSAERLQAKLRRVMYDDGSGTLGFDEILKRLADQRESEDKPKNDKVVREVGAKVSSLPKKARSTMRMT